MSDDSSVNILVVDDRPEKLLALGVVLEELGENVVCVDSGREALRQVLKHEFAVILLDVNMPAMDGFETAQLIRQRATSAGVPIIFLTAAGDDMHVARSYSLGAVDYMLTPVVPQVLRSKVSVFVDLFKKSHQVRLQADRLRQRASQLHQLTTASIAINSAPSVDKIIEIATDTARLIIEAHQAFTLTAAGHYPIQPAGRASYSAKYGAWEGMPPRIENPALLALLNGTGKALRMVQDELETVVPPLASEPTDTRRMPPLHGLLSAPLNGRNGANMGTIVVSEKIGGNFTDDDQAILIQLAQMASVAIENVIFTAEREANRVKEEFLSTLSHELRTPLTAISGWIQLLRRDVSREDLDHGMEVIERNVQAQTRLIEDLLDLSRISTNKLRLNVRKLSLRPLLEGAVDAVRPTAVQRGINLVCNFACDNAALSGDPDRLQQVFGNILGNAMKFTPAGGTITVAAAQENGDITVSVADSGEGIDPDFLPFIFDRFRQAESTQARRHGGLGIGLAIVKHIVQLHHGSVAAESAGKGLGTKIRLTLPVASTETAKPLDLNESPQEDSSSIQGVDVLLVDDDADTREVVGHILRSHHATVVSAASAREAMRLLATRIPDVIVTDIGMPEEDGYALLRAVRGLRNGSDAHLPVIALTAYASGDDRNRALGAGFHEHLGKPVNPRELIAAIHRCAAARTHTSKSESQIQVRLESDRMAQPV